jgi:hypothetical protein
VFAHRYRDTTPALRALSIEHLGTWVAALPEYYLKDNYLKYIGWTLSDKDVAVRLAALNALTTLLADKANLASLKHFCHRFLDRLMEMTRDVHASCAAAAIRLVTVYLGLGWLGRDDGMHVPSLMFDADEDVQQAAGQFVYEDVFADDSGSDEQPKSAAPTPAAEQIVQLLNVLEDASPPDTELEVATRALVGALWSRLPLLHDWEALVRELRLAGEEGAARGGGSGSGGSAAAAAGAVSLDDKRQTHLAFLLLAAAERCVPAANLPEPLDPDASSGASALSSSFSKLKLTTAEEKKRATALSACLLAQLPALLTIFQADVQKLIALVQLPRFLDLAAIGTHRASGPMFDALLRALHTVYLKHTEARVG